MPTSACFPIYQLRLFQNCVFFQVSLKAEQLTGILPYTSEVRQGPCQVVCFKEISAKHMTLDGTEEMIFLRSRNSTVRGTAWHCVALCGTAGSISLPSARVCHRTSGNKRYGCASGQQPMWKVSRHLGSARGMLCWVLVPPVPWSSFVGYFPIKNGTIIH